MGTFEVGLMHFCLAISPWGPGSVMCLFEKKMSSKGNGIIRRYDFFQQVYHCGGKI